MILSYRPGEEMRDQEMNLFLGLAMIIYGDAICFIAVWEFYTVNDN